jgi:hypothetical protein
MGAVPTVPWSVWAEGRPVPAPVGTRLNHFNKVVPKRKPHFSTYYASSLNSIVALLSTITKTKNPSTEVVVPVASSVSADLRSELHPW